MGGPLAPRPLTGHLRITLKTDSQADTQSSTTNERKLGHVPKFWIRSAGGERRVKKRKRTRGEFRGTRNERAGANLAPAWPMASVHPRTRRLDLRIFTPTTVRELSTRHWGAHRQRGGWGESCCLRPSRTRSRPRPRPSKSCSFRPQDRTRHPSTAFSSSSEARVLARGHRRKKRR